MSRIGTTSTSGCGAPSEQQSPATGEHADTRLASGRRAFLQEVQQDLNAWTGPDIRAALILLEVDQNYLRRSARPIGELLQEWHRSGTQNIRCARVDEKRYAIFVAPIGFDAQPQRLAQHLTHALDPRVCPLLRRALPYACWGVGVFSAADSDAAMLLTAAERDLEQRRRSGTRCARMLRPSRRRSLTSPALGRLAVP